MPEMATTNKATDLTFLETTRLKIRAIMLARRNAHLTQRAEEDVRRNAGRQRQRKREREGDGIGVMRDFLTDLVAGTE